MAAAAEEVAEEAPDAVKEAVRGGGWRRRWGLGGVGCWRRRGCWLDCGGGVAGCSCGVVDLREGCCPLVRRRWWRWVRCRRSWCRRLEAEGRCGGSWGRRLGRGCWRNGGRGWSGACAGAVEAGAIAVEAEGGGDLTRAGSCSKADDAWGTAAAVRALRGGEALGLGGGEGVGGGGICEAEPGRAACAASVGVPVSATERVGAGGQPQGEVSRSTTSRRLACSKRRRCWPGRMSVSGGTELFSHGERGGGGAAVFNAGVTVRSDAQAEVEGAGGARGGGDGLDGVSGGRGSVSRVGGGGGHVELDGTAIEGEKKGCGLAGAGGRGRRGGQRWSRQGSGRRGRGRWWRCDHAREEGNDGVATDGGLAVGEIKGESVPETVAVAATMVPMGAWAASRAGELSRRMAPTMGREGCMRAAGNSWETG